MRRRRRRARVICINVDLINVDLTFRSCHHGDVSTLIGSTEAATTLGVTKPTLYAYVSRGLVARQVAVDGRTSLYDRTEIEALANRSRRQPAAERPSIDVKIATAITRLHDDSPTYRGDRVVDLVTTRSFEQVADLLFADGRPESAWRLDTAALTRARTIVDAAAPVSPITALGLAAMSLDGESSADAAVVARQLLTIAPSILGGPQNGGIAGRLTRAWRRRPPPELVDAVSTALILLADHELATSTLAVRVAASVRTSPAAAIATGLHVVAGPFHGAASQAASRLFELAADVGATDAVGSYRRRGERLPGFGHSVYRRGDPRFEPLLGAVRRIPAPAERLRIVDEVIAEAGRSIGHLPNIDLALGALYHVADLPADAPVFAVARVAGWAAHYDEELGERPVRFRGLSR